MFDPKKLLDAVMGASATQVVSGRPDRSPGQGANIPSSGVHPGQSAESTVSGNFSSMIGQVLGQAASGLKDAARDVDARTGIRGKADEMLKQGTGRDAGELWAQARELAAQNKLATGAAIGGLAGLLLGTGTGRSVAAVAAKLGGLAVVGGLAYKALQNYQAGKPPIDLGGHVEPAPAESPFGHTSDPEKDKQTAMLIVRAMIAAASADGMVDNAERNNIVGGLERAGLDVSAAKFLDDEFARPMSIEALISSVSTPEIAAQVYTAARLAVNPDHHAEHQFLEKLAAGLKLEPEFIAQVDAATRSVQSQA